MALMVSAAVTVRANIPDMELSTTSSTARSPQLEYHLDWNRLVCLAPMARGLMGYHLSVGRPLVWDATCPDTYAQSHRLHSTITTGRVAEKKKAEKYAHLAPAHHFQPVAIETSDAIGPTSRSFLKELGR